MSLLKMMLIYVNEMLLLKTTFYDHTCLTASALTD